MYMYILFLVSGFDGFSHIPHTWLKMAAGYYYVLFLRGHVCDVSEIFNINAYIDRHKSTVTHFIKLGSRFWCACSAVALILFLRNPFRKGKGARSTVSLHYIMRNPFRTEKGARSAVCLNYRMRNPFRTGRGGCPMSSA